jgi:hypothetical protein
MQVELTSSEHHLSRVIAMNISSFQHGTFPLECKFLRRVALFTCPWPVPHRHIICGVARN